MSLNFFVVELGCYLVKPALKTDRFTDKIRGEKLSIFEKPSTGMLGFDWVWAIQHQVTLNSIILVFIWCSFEKNCTLQKKSKGLSLFVMGIVMRRSSKMHQYNTVQNRNVSVR